MYCDVHVLYLDLRPLPLLQYLVPDRNELPPGVEIAYDPHAGIHVFRFQASTIPSRIPDRFSFLAAKLYATGTGSDCHYFPEEFSLLFTFKMSARKKLKTAEVFQCLFAISSRGKDDQLHCISHTTHPDLMFTYWRCRDVSNNSLFTRDAAWYSVFGGTCPYVCTVCNITT